ncbi:MAG: hypothetical protein VXZ96_19055 [Myxococcota bacterium]|nr:hypothetical protein [Myxococcota bacterium]
MILLIPMALAAPEDSYLNSKDRAWAIQPKLEIGFLAPFSNEIQLGKNGTTFDYVEEGGENNLFRYTRWEINFRNDRHMLGLLFQPFDVTTRAIAQRELTFDNVVIPEGTPMSYRYGFDYYRGTYSYDLLKDPKREFGIGCALQIRNATLDFISLNGEYQDSNRDIGPVPLFHMQGRFPIPNDRWWGFTADGAYAPIKYLNGDSSDVVGALLDTNLAAGFRLNRGVDVSLGVRYIGGGAEGTEREPDPGKDGYVSNWLHLGVLNLGLGLR